MRIYSFKIVMTAMALFCLLPLMQAQFDDVYYNPDDVQTQSYDDQSYDDQSYDSGNNDDVTYYDDDEYTYYDDYDYYYTSRIKRFYRPYTGFSFYDPVYVSYNYYDPFFHDSYYYPGASIYISFGNDYWGYRNWRRYNRFNQWNNWGYSPASYYYSYNNWHHHDHHYWGGYHGYHGYSNYYNNYYNGCPIPISHYNGITHTTVTNINNGGTRGTYYGPRLAGSTGSSPRGPVDKPGSVQPVMRDGVTSGDTPTTSNGNDDGSGVTTPRTQNPLPRENTPGIGRTDVPSGTDLPGKVGIEDKEISRDEATPRSQRPVFKPYPTEQKPTGNVRTDPDKTPANSTPQTKPSGTDRTIDAPRPSTSPERSPRDDDRPQYQPSPRDNADRPVYTPRTEERPSYTPRTEERPRYTPPARSETRPTQRTEEQPRYTPPARSERSESRPVERSNDSGRSRESYSPPSRSDNSSGRSYSPPSRSEGSSSGSSRSSSSGSPRSGGRG